MKVALFGSRGYLGTQLAHFLSARGAEVAGFDVPDCDVTSADFWRGFAPADHDAIVFFAGMTGTERSFTDADRFLSVNEQGLLNLLKALAPLGDRAPFVVFPSSRLVYRGSESALREDAPKEARTVYAANKLACEALLQAYAARYGVRHAVVRICVPYGNLVSHDYSYGTLGFFLKQAAAGAISLYGDGAVRRTFSHVADICEAVARLAERRAAGTFNIGGTALSLAEAAELVARRKGARVEFRPWPEEALRVESGSTFFDAAALDAAVGPLDYRSFVQFASEL